MYMSMRRVPLYNMIPQYLQLPDYPTLPAATAGGTKGGNTFLPHEMLYQAAPTRFSRSMDRCSSIPNSPRWKEQPFAAPPTLINDLVGTPPLPVWPPPDRHEDRHHHHHHHHHHSVQGNGLRVYSLTGHLQKGLPHHSHHDPSFPGCHRDVDGNAAPAAVRWSPVPGVYAPAHHAEHGRTPPVPLKNFNDPTTVSEHTVSGRHMLCAYGVVQIATSLHPAAVRVLNERALTPLGNAGEYQPQQLFIECHSPATKHLDPVPKKKRTRRGHRGGRNRRRFQQKRAQEERWTMDDPPNNTTSSQAVTAALDFLLRSEEQQHSAAWHPLASSSQLDPVTRQEAADVLTRLLLSAYGI